MPPQRSEPAMSFAPCRTSSTSFGAVWGRLVVQSAPHEWLFPRCSAVVHHGGAGTVMAGLAAGKPTVVTAFFGDQPYWGYRVQALGAGPPPILRRDLDAPRLAGAIQRVVSEESYRRSAENVATRVRAEDGVANAVETIQAILAKSGT